MANHFDLPFNDILDWRKFSIIIKVNDVRYLKKILKSITFAEYRVL